MNDVPKPRIGALKVKNDGFLSIFPLGTGGAFSKKLYQNNYLLIKGEEHLLIDCGARTPQVLFELGFPITGIENLLITHSHADHVGGLEEVALMGRYMTKKRPAVVITPEYQRILWTNSLKGGAAYNERQGNKLLGFEDFFVPIYPEPSSKINRQGWSLKFRGFDLFMFRTMHIPDSTTSWRQSAYSIGLVVDKRFLFTGDTRYDPELIAEVTRAFPIEMAFHDVQFFPGGVHAFFDEIATLPREFKKITYLMHYPDTYEAQESKVKDAGFRGFVTQHSYYDFPKS